MIWRKSGPGKGPAKAVRAKPPEHERASRNSRAKVAAVEEGGQEDVGSGRHRNHSMQDSRGHCKNAGIYFF